MAVSPDVLIGPRLKVERAYRHIDELISLSQPLSPELYKVEIARVFSDGSMVLAKPNLLPPEYRFQYRSLKPVAKTFALVIGDAVHNLRGALDHLATGIVRTMSWNAEIGFPMRKRREDLISAAGHPIPELDAIEAALPGSIHLILDEVRPPDGPNESLWGFHVLDNDDKHNLILPTVAVTDVKFRQMHVGGNLFDMISFGFNADQPAPFVMVSSKGTPITVDGQVNTSVDVKFGDGTPFKDQAVVPTLTQIAQVVAETINAFEGLILA